MLTGKKQAFTLIELLVVVAIVALLASLLLPSLHRTKLSADGAVCRNNDRQMGIAMRLYLDHEGVYPFEWETNFWCREIEEYANDRWPSNNLVGRGAYSMRRGIFACPGFGRLPGFYTRDGADLGYRGPIGAYTYNAQGSYNASDGMDHFNRGLGISYAEGGSLFWHPVKEDAVINPSDMIAVTDTVIVRAAVFLPGDVRFGDGYWGSADWTWDITQPFVRDGPR
jgi:prepilin-type N-terminal cleavage/methylation domain-containing protein